MRYLTQGWQTTRKFRWAAIMEPENSPTLTSDDITRLRATHSEVLRLRGSLFLMDKALNATRARLEVFLELGISASLAVHSAIVEIEHLSAGIGRDIQPLKELDADIQSALSRVKDVLGRRSNV